MITDLLDPLGRLEFAAGLRFGLIGLAVGLFLALLQRGGRPVAVGGLLVSAAFALALRSTLGMPGWFALGLVGLVGAGALGGLPAVAASGPILAAPGAGLVVAGAEVELERWMAALAVMAIVVGSWLLADFDARWRHRGLGPLLFAISTAGIYSTVPDTEQALVALGASLPLALLSWPLPLGSLGSSGAYAATGMLIWVVMVGGIGRGSAIVGGVACLGLLAVEPVARLLDRRGRSMLECLPSGRWGALVAASLHVALVSIGARVAGTRPTVAAAAAIALVELAVAVVLALVGARKLGRCK